MKPGDLVQFIDDANLTDQLDRAAIMIVLQINKDSYKDDGWSFCTAGRKTADSVDVFYPSRGIRTYKSWALKVVSGDHTSIEHAKLTALAFAGSCSNKEGECG